MTITRRDALKVAAAGAAGLGLSRFAGTADGPPAAGQTPAARVEPVATERAPKPLRILILGGTGFTGPYQVRYALARGHTLTLFNRGRRPKEWPGAVEELGAVDRESASRFL